MPDLSALLPANSTTAEFLRALSATIGFVQAQEERIAKLEAQVQDHESKLKDPPPPVAGDGK